ncbi:TRAP transporter small permease [Pelagibacterium montanilacus]|uniref:TRAP transporter small permease n=1 Tax=Pelagibacterium montanilacus TaxID=2185280 RepID=UPI000F8F5EB0|nr:TRAP transporter small permease subunit [Pelagibacterium montanilacus]
MTSLGMSVPPGSSPPPTLVSRLSRAVQWILETAAMILMGAMAILVFANAFSRYTFSRPLPWTEEVVSNILVWLVAVGVVLAGIRQILICCDILSVRLKAPTLRLVTIFCTVVGAVVLAYCAWLTWQYLDLFGGDRSSILRLPKSIMISAIFFALAGLSATLLISLFRRG